jgi:thymidylate synthase ThyX
MDITQNITTFNQGLATATVLNLSYGEIVTFELKYPRYIHSEFMTHRMFSRNAQSSRATPIDILQQDVLDDPVVPLELYKNCKGMAGKEEVDPETYDYFTTLWLDALYAVSDVVDLMKEEGIHKQHINRLLEPFSYIKVICTTTMEALEHFFYLRIQPDAQPEIRDLAYAMEQAVARHIESYGLVKRPYHIPYVDHPDSARTEDIIKAYLLSAARCARVSYLKFDGKTPSEQDDLRLAQQLLENGHMSPFEHQACRVDDYEEPLEYYANLQGWQSFRYMLETYDAYYDLCVEILEKNLQPS